MAKKPIMFGLPARDYPVDIYNINVRKHQQKGCEPRQLIDVSVTTSVQPKQLKGSPLHDDLYCLPDPSKGVLDLEEGQLVARDGKKKIYGETDKGWTALILDDNGKVEQELYCEHGIALGEARLAEDKTQPNPLVTLTMTLKGVAWECGEDLLLYDTKMRFTSKTKAQRDADVTADVEIVIDHEVVTEGQETLPGVE